MNTKRIVTKEDSKNFFNTTINSIEDAYGISIIDIQNKLISFDFNSVLLLSFHQINANEKYQLDSPSFIDGFSDIIHKCITDDITEKTEYLFERKLKNSTLHFTIKIEPLNNNFINLHIINYEKLTETQKELAIFSKILNSTSDMFVGSTWWTDYDRHSDFFYQTDEGPKILGMTISKNQLYNTREFQRVRELASSKSPFFDECIKMEEQSFNDVRNNKTDYFAGRTPAYTKNDEIVWVEAYGKCFLRYKDGSPRFFVAIDIYLSDVVQSTHQLNILNNLINIGLINSKVGVWYYQKNFVEGRYYFTQSYRDLMKFEGEYNNDNISQFLRNHHQKMISHTPEFKEPLNNFIETHNKLFTGELEKYQVVVPNSLDKANPQWIEVRGTVIERDENGSIILFVGVNIDITQSVLRNIELEQLRIQNDRLQLAEKLAIKAGNVIVWYQDENHISNDNQVFGNYMLNQKLGISRDKNGIIKLADLRKTIISDDPESKALSKKFYREIFDIYRRKTNSLKNLLVKHKNVVTGKTVYLEHSIEVEEINPDNSIKLIGGFMLDVTDNIYKNERITFLANYDILTQVHNRNYFDNFVNTNQLPRSYTVLLFDIDGLKLINDAFGHIQGDKIIRDFANFLKTVYHDSACIARIGGDEFVVISEIVTHNEITNQVNSMEKVLADYNKDSHIKLIVSKGGREVVNRDLTFEKAFMMAENLMYRRKLNNRTSRKSLALESIMETLNAKTEETKEHSERMALHALKTLSELGFNRSSEVEDIKLLTRVHDIGKITIPDSILNKKETLTDEEYDTIKKHCEAGYKIVKNITDSDNVSMGVLSHHERWDGKGYPQGLSGNNISIYARVISVVDAFDAMTHQRIYQAAKTEEIAIEEIIRCSGSQFDPKVVKAFLKSCFNIDLK